MVKGPGSSRGIGYGNMDDSTLADNMKKLTQLAQDSKLSPIQTTEFIRSGLQHIASGEKVEHFGPKLILEIKGELERRLSTSTSSSVEKKENSPTLDTKEKMIEKKETEQITRKESSATKKEELLPEKILDKEHALIETKSNQEIEKKEQDGMKRASLKKPEVSEKKKGKEGKESLKFGPVLQKIELIQEDPFDILTQTLASYASNSPYPTLFSEKRFANLERLSEISQMFQKKSNFLT